MDNLFSMHSLGTVLMVFFTIEWNTVLLSLFFPSGESFAFIVFSAVIMFVVGPSLTITYAMFVIFAMIAAFPLTLLYYCCIISSSKDKKRKKWALLFLLATVFGANAMRAYVDDRIPMPCISSCRSIQPPHSPFYVVDNMQDVCRGTFSSVFQLGYIDHLPPGVEDYSSVLGGLRIETGNVFTLPTQEEEEEEEDENTLSCCFVLMGHLEFSFASFDLCNNYLRRGCSLPAQSLEACSDLEREIMDKETEIVQCHNNNKTLDFSAWRKRDLCPEMVELYYKPTTQQILPKDVLLAEREEEVHPFRLYVNTMFAWLSWPMASCSSRL